MRNEEMDDQYQSSYDPPVTVVVSSFNQGSFIRETIESGLSVVGGRD